MLPILYSITLLVVVGGFSAFVFATQHVKVIKVKEENTQFKQRVNEFQMYSKLKLKDIADKSNDKYAKVATAYDQLNNEIDKYNAANAKYAKEQQNDLRSLSQQTAKDSDVLRDMINSKDIYVDRQKKKVIDETYASIQNTFNRASNLQEVQDVLGLDPLDGKYYAKDFELVDNSGVSVLKLRKKMNDLKTQINSDLVLNYSRNVNTLRGLQENQDQMVQAVQDRITSQRGVVTPDTQILDEQTSMTSRINSLATNIDTDYQKVFERVTEYQSAERSNVISKVNEDNVERLKTYREQLVKDAQQSAMQASLQNTQLQNNLNQFQSEWSTKFQDTTSIFNSQLLDLQRSYDDKKRVIDDTSQNIRDLQDSVSRDYLLSSQFANKMASSTSVKSHLHNQVTNRSNQVLQAPSFAITGGMYAPRSTQATDHLVDLYSRTDQLGSNLDAVILPYTQNARYANELSMNETQTIHFGNDIRLAYSSSNNAINIDGNVNIKGNMFVIRNGNPLWVNKSIVENAVSEVERLYEEIAQSNITTAQLNSKASSTHNHDDIYLLQTDLNGMNNNFSTAASGLLTLDKIRDKSIHPNRIKQLHLQSVDFTGATPEKFPNLQGANTLLSSVQNISASNINFQPNDVPLSSVTIPDNALNIGNFNTNTLSTFNVSMRDIRVDPQTIPSKSVASFPLINHQMLPFDLKTQTYDMDPNYKIDPQRVDWEHNVDQMSVENLRTPNAYMMINGTEYALKKVS